MFDLVFNDCSFSNLDLFGEKYHSAKDNHMMNCLLSSLQNYFLRPQSLLYNFKSLRCKCKANKKDKQQSEPPHDQGKEEEQPNFGESLI